MMNQLCHKKIMDKLDFIEKKIDYANTIYTKKYIIINKPFMMNFCLFLLYIIIFFAFLSLFY